MKNLLRNLAYVSVIVAAMSFTIHNLNQPAQAQIGGQNVVAVSGGDGSSLVYTSSGDVYHVNANPFDSEFLGNVFSEQPIPVAPTTWSGVKTLIKN